MLWSLEADDVAFLRHSLADLNGTAFVSGSLAAGLGHANSDLDVHVFRRAKDAPDLSRLTAPSGRSVQFTVMTEEDLVLCERVNAPLATSPTDRGLFYLTPAELWVLFRASVAVPLVQDQKHSWLFGEHFRRSVARVLIATNAHEAARAADDAFGMRESGEELSSLDIARSALRNASEMFLASIGDLYASPKFLIPRLLRHRDDWPAACISLHLLLAPDPPIEAVLQVAQELSCWSQLYGWQENPTRTAAKLLSQPAGNGLGYRRDLRAWPLRYSRAWSLARAGHEGFSVGNHLAALWCAVGATDTESIRLSLATLGMDATSSDIEAGLTRLLELGLLVREGGERRGGRGDQGLGHLRGRDERCRQGLAQ